MLFSYPLSNKQQKNAIMKKNIVLLLTLSITSALLFTGCGGGSSDTSTPTNPDDPNNTSVPTNPPDPTVKVTITDEYQVESLGTASTISAEVSLGNTAKDLYLVLSNYAATSASSTITHNAKVAETAQSKSVSLTSFTEKPVILRAPGYVQEFTANIGALLSRTETSQPQAKTIAVPERMEKEVGETEEFCVNIELVDGNCTQTTAATLKKVQNIETAIKTKTLNIWVSDDSFDNGSGCSKSKCVTREMVDALADSFLKDGLDNDIYDWVTNIYEEEWGSAAQTKNSYYIPEDNEITILLTDIPNDQEPIYDTPNGGIIGFFWQKDNYKSSIIGGSNERVMFYVDAVMFANGEGIWDIDDFWPKEMVSTLAHEFQHMINFYQKRILLDTDIDTWINEMLSETTEDLIATKIKHIGPRGIDYTDGSDGPTGNTNGRYPLFNENNTLSLTAWNNALADYSKVNAFGTFLIRNYGGAQLLHDIMHNTYTDEQAVVDAVNKSVEGSGKTFDDLISEWGTAVLLSDIESPEDLPTYNTGWFTDSVHGETTYEMGSINFFHYAPLPTIHTTSGTVSAQGNYYYKIGENLTGDITIDLELNGQTEAILIAK